jgi:hypothetical protein
VGGTVISVVPGGSGSVAEWVRAAEGWERIGAGVVRVGGPSARDVGRALREATRLVVQAGLDGLGAEPELVLCPVEAEAHRRVRDLGLVAAYEVGPGAGPALRRLLEEDGPPYGGHVHCELVLDGSLPDTVGGLPDGATFSAAGRGDAGVPVMLASLAAGGHLTVGRSLTPDYAPGEPARDDGRLAARAAGLARIAQRPPATPDEVRTLLGLTRR